MGVYIIICVCVHVYVCMYARLGGEIVRRRICPTQNRMGNCKGASCPGVSTELSGGRVVREVRCPFPIKTGPVEIVQKSQIIRCIRSGSHYFGIFFSALSIPAVDQNKPQRVRGSSVIAADFLLS